VDQASHPPIAAGADDQQIERGAVHPELLGRVPVRRVRLHAAQRLDTLARVVDEALERVIDRCWAAQKCVGRKRHRFEGREFGATLGDEISSHRDGVLALG